MADSIVSKEEKEILYQIAYQLKISIEKITKNIEDYENKLKAKRSIKKKIHLILIIVAVFVCVVSVTLIFTNFSDNASSYSESSSDSEKTGEKSPIVEEEYIEPKQIITTWNIAVVKYEPTTFWTLDTGNMARIVSPVQSLSPEEMQTTIDEIRDKAIDFVAGKNTSELQYKITESYFIQIHTNEPEQTDDYTIAKRDKISEYIDTVYQYNIDDDFKLNVENFVKDYVAN